MEILFFYVYGYGRQFGAKPCAFWLPPARFYLDSFLDFLDSRFNRDPQHAEWDFRRNSFFCLVES